MVWTWWFNMFYTVPFKTTFSNLWVFSELLTLGKKFGIKFHLRKGASKRVSLAFVRERGLNDNVPNMLSMTTEKLKWYLNVPNPGTNKWSWSCSPLTRLQTFLFFNFSFSFRHSQGRPPSRRPYTVTSFPSFTLSVTKDSLMYCGVWYGSLELRSRLH